jgi:uncharacterized membrane protein YwaF
MLIAEDAAAAAATSHFSGFDIFVILFTLLILFGVIRSIGAKKKNLLAIGFGVVCLAVFLIMDVVMVMNWAGAL